MDVSTAAFSQYYHSCFYYLVVGGCTAPIPAVNSALNLVYYQKKVYFIFNLRSFWILHHIVFSYIYEEFSGKKSMECINLTGILKAVVALRVVWSNGTLYLNWYFNKVTSLFFL